MEIALTIRNQVGLHARPAALFVKCAAAFKDTKLEIVKDGQARDAKSILQVLTLGVGAGTTIIVRAEGPESEAALQAIAALVENDFHSADPRRRGEPGAAG